jgi:3-hydroxyacyl-CoA dehydrogenase
MMLVLLTLFLQLILLPFLLPKLERWLPERVIGMHFMNPVPIMKLVEIIGWYTSDEVTKTIMTLSEKLGKHR